MKFNFILIDLCIGLLLQCTGTVCRAQPFMQENGEDIPKIQNPISVAYLKSNLQKSLPRLVLTPAVENNLKEKLKTDPVVKNLYQAIRLNAEEILKQPLLTRNKIGGRLLVTSQEMLYRMNMLGMVYRIEKSTEILKRINDELVAVCNFEDWNPGHYLDVAEMSMAVATALDWTAGSLPKPTIELAKNTLIEKGIRPSFSGAREPAFLSRLTNNWNPVCNGSMIAAAIAIAEKDPELAAKTISRSLESMPRSLIHYAPDGVCYEGVTYWDYGTGYFVIASSLLESAFGTDFGISSYPPLLKSAVCRLLCVAPSGEYFDFSDCGTSHNEIVLAWYAKQTGDALYYEGQKYLRNPVSMGKLSRFAGYGLIWLSQFEPKSQSSLPLAWKGEGKNSLIFFQGGEDDPRQYYFGANGGAHASHGHMDFGSFIFELEGVRWVMDMGNQDYTELELAGYDHWNGDTNESPRWRLLSKGNFGHNTLIVDNSPFERNGNAPLIDFKAGDTPEATFDMTEIYKGHLKSAKRRFIKDTDHSITIEDNFILEDTTRILAWGIMTTADVFMTENGAILKKDDKQLNLEIISPPNVGVSILMMNPPPMKLDKKIKGLKRIELRVPAYLYTEGTGSIKVRLSSPE
jgi:hypothetical protein